MSATSLFDRLINLPEPPAGAHVPPPELIAFVVRTARSLSGWKQSTVAQFADVSLSTVERVERGEPVSVEALDRIATGLGYERGYFTAPRIATSNEEAARLLHERYGHLLPVTVAPIRTQAQVRALAKCDGLVFHRLALDEDANSLVDSLAEWLDLGSFLLSDLAPADAGLRRGRGRRAYYGDVLSHVSEISRKGCTVLGGVAALADTGRYDWRIAVVSITAKRVDPAASRRKTVFVDSRHWSEPLSHQEDRDT